MGNVLSINWRLTTFGENVEWTCFVQGCNARKKTFGSSGRMEMEVNVSDELMEVELMYCVANRFL